MPIDLKNSSYVEIEQLVAGLSEKPYRAKQIAVWVFHRGIQDIDEMTDLSKSLRIKLKEAAFISKIGLLTTHNSTDGSVRFLFSLKDNNRIESVIIKDKERVTLCISTQVGCKMGCIFCSTGKIGFIRNLDASEILDQILFQRRENGEIFNITNIVLMGMGEPLDNYENVIKATRWMFDPLGLNISRKKITISTCGLIPEIDTLLKSDINVNLAVSLNASTDEVRTRLMPVNKRYPIKELIKACNNIPSNMRVTYEYIIIKGVNDSKDDAFRLTRLLQRDKVKINLIPFNPFPGVTFEAPEESTINAFRDRLIAEGFTALTRMSKGRDINSACGQLTAGYLHKADS